MGNCLHCHTTDAHALGTNGNFANNGLDTYSTMDRGMFASSLDSSDLGKFKVPTLRNLLFTPPYMHDGRFETLEEVLDFYGNHVEKSDYLDSQMNYFIRNKPLFSQEEKSQVIAFLKTLTDSSFVEQQVESIP